MFLDKTFDQGKYFCPNRTVVHYSPDYLYSVLKYTKDFQMFILFFFSARDAIETKNKIRVINIDFIQVIIKGKP